jgi:hypothetical protein
LNGACAGFPVFDCRKVAFKRQQSLREDSKTVPSANLLAFRRLRFFGHPRRMPSE